MKNTLTDLNNHLFLALERINDEDISTEELEIEMERAKTVANVAKTITDNARLALEVLKFEDNKLSADTKIPRMLIGNGE